jgi:hypothetical protein
MLGLKSIYPDDAQRYKVIVEECLYFADINPTNIYICKTIHYSSENKGQIGNKKVILTMSEYQYPFNDFNGKYGMSPIVFGLKINSKKRG